MKKEELIKKIENISLPEVEFPSHQRRLKMTLLNSGYWKEKSSMSLLKKFAPIGAVAAISLLVVAGVNYLKNPSLVSQNGLLAAPSAYAKELVGQAQKQLADVKAIAAFPDPNTGIIQWKTPDDNGNIRDEKGNIVFITSPEGELVPVSRETPAISQTVTKDFALLLEEAYRSEDLVYLGDKVLSDGKRIKMIRYSPDYSKTDRSDIPRFVVLGIGENNLPVVKIIYDGAGSGTVFQQGGPKDPNAPRPQNIEEEIKRWTENLENQPQDQTDFKAIQK